MKKYLILIFAVLILIPQLSFAKKILLRNKKIQPKKLKIHPLQKFFNKNPKHISKSNKLLCLLIDFQKDDNPLTTGNGKFLTKNDANSYPITLGKPPHDYNFFMQELKALKHYYLAASFGAFDLDYDLFPKPESGKIAYTLPHTMDYYNPPNASQDLMIARFEEYFQDIFTEADKDENIHFADYGHFMVIHAGSDWQHDIKGDSPCDIPSFFIRVSDDKKVWVDNHTISIDHTCNVPEMITQDIQVIPSDSQTEVYGYGVVNAVMAHEFGHSLGFVDLYSTLNNRPGVGFFDIMDSGGSGMLGVTENDTIYYVEGGLPVLPSAWHRILAWEDNFRARGILKNISELNFNSDITINPAEKQLIGFTSSNPYFIKVPIDDKEYLLIENRQVDPDGDGGTAVKSTSDKRVILYPIHNNDDPSDTLATYEYDFLLPGWITDNGRFVGGGLLIWHIDDKIIYDEGNYDANTVNRNFYHRGIKVVEADNILDIGNIHSAYWLGTPFEPYFRYQPILRNNVFVGWNDQTSTDGEELGIFNDELSSSSKPILQTNNKKSSYFRIYDISSYPIGDLQEREMSFKFGINGYEKTYELDMGQKDVTLLGPINKIGFLANEDAELPIAHKNGFSIASLSFGQWLLFDLYDYKNISQISVIDYSDNTKKYLITHENKLDIADIAPIASYQYPDTIINYPIYIKDTNEYAVSTSDKVYIGNDAYNYENAKCFYNGSDILISTNNFVYLIDAQSHSLKKTFNIPDFDNRLEVVSFVDTLNSQNTASFVLNKKGELYKISGTEINRIFSSSDFVKGEPSQLALFTDNEGFTSICYGVKDKVFALSLDGSLKSHFPATIENNIEAYSDVMVILQSGLPFIYFATEDNYISAIGEDGNTYKDLSYIQTEDLIRYDTCITTGKTYLTTKYPANKIILSETTSENKKVIWQGKRNCNFSVLYGTYKQYTPLENSKLNAYAFPNPAKFSSINFRIYNATSQIDLSIYNITGNVIKRKTFSKTNYKYQDIRFDIANLSSGVYFAVIKSGKEIKKIAFAIEK